jgi:hypothetical protein
MWLWFCVIFHSKYTEWSEIQSDEEMEDSEKEPQAAQNNNTASSHHKNQISVETIHISYQEPEVSGKSDTDSHMSLLQIKWMLLLQILW